MGESLFMGKETKKVSRQMDMLHGGLFKNMLAMALPLAACSILQQLFNSVGVAVVGRFAGSEALAAVGSNGAVISLLVTLFSGISLGANVIIANYIGEGNDKKIPEVVHTAVTMALLSGALLLVLGQIVAHPILLLMGAPENVIELATVYLRIYFLGMPFMMLYDFGASILRSIGDTRRPLLALIFSGIVNVILNFLLVAGFHLDVAGAGIATVGANAVSATLVVLFLLHEEEPIRVSFKKLTINTFELGRILRIGIPAGLQGMVFSLANVCIQSSINSFGSDAIAGSAAALNFEYITYFIVNGFAQTTVTFTSQNYGAKLYDRCKKVFREAMLASILFCGSLSMIIVLGRDFFIQLYTTDPVVTKYAMIRLVIITTFEFLTSTYEISGGALRGMGHSMTPAILTVFGSCVLRLIWISTAIRVWHSYTLLISIYPISWVLTGAMVSTAYFITRKKLLR